MFSKYFLIFIINATICYSFMVLPSDDRHQAASLLKQQNLKGVGEPLILTPYLKSNQASKAQKLSSVKSLLNGEKIFSNAGYFTVDEKYNSNLFFWFFRKTSSDWLKAPIILWLQGGPGCSSLYGLFEENGPFTVTEKVLKKTNYSWTNDFNVLYIDQPVGTGFSFTNSSKGFIGTQEQVADHLYEALRQFFQLYPELRKNAFYVSGESYAGRYIPAISYKIHTLKKANLTDINLKGLFMISASTQGQYNGFLDYCFNIGIIDSQARTKLQPLEQMLNSSISSKEWKNASLSQGALLYSVGILSSVSSYDYTQTKSSDIDDLYNPPFKSILTEASTRRKIHVGNANYSTCNTEVHSYFKEDQPKSVVPWIEELVNHYPVAFVGGQFDVIVAYPLVVSVMEKLNWKGAAKYKTAERKIFNEKYVDGYIKSAGNLKDILIRNAGHMVPKDQPRAALDLLNKFVNGKL